MVASPPPPSAPVSSNHHKIVENKSREPSSFLDLRQGQGPTNLLHKNAQPSTKGPGSPLSPPKKLHSVDDEGVGGRIDLGRGYTIRLLCKFVHFFTDLVYLVGTY